MKFNDKIKKAIKQKSKEKISQPEALFEIDAIRAKYNTLDELKAALKSAREFSDTLDRESKRRRQEDRRHLAVEWVGGIFAFVGVNSLLFILLHRLRIFELPFDRWGLGWILGWIIVILWLGFAFLVVSAFFWLSDKTGLHYLIEDWIVSWDTWDAQQSHNIHKYKTFPRRKRRPLIRDLKKELDVITDNLYRLEWEADETEDKKLSESVENLNQVIDTLVTEADISSRSLIHQPEHTSWKGFVLALEETSNDLELELQDIAKYHKSVQPLLKHASNITSQVLYRIIDYGDEKKEGRIIKA